MKKNKSSQNVIRNTEGDDGVGIESIVDDAVVVPIIQSTHPQEYDTTSLFACQKGIPKKLRYAGFGMTLAFAVTDFKLQGKTLDELVLSVAPRPFPPHMDLKGFYVATSRVREKSKLRVLHVPKKHKGALQHLLKLKHTPELKIWQESYDRRGDWCKKRALAAAKKLKKAEAKNDDD